jgi:hypothetical protein
MKGVMRRKLGSVTERSVPRCEKLLFFNEIALGVTWAVEMGRVSLSPSPSLPHPQGCCRQASRRGWMTPGVVGRSRAVVSPMTQILPSGAVVAHWAWPGRVWACVGIARRTQSARAKQRRRALGGSFIFASTAKTFWRRS